MSAVTTSTMIVIIIAAPVAVSITILSEALQPLFRYLRSFLWVALARTLNIYRPATIEDQRFNLDKHRRWFSCDECQKVVQYRGQLEPFAGNFVHGPPSNYEFLAQGLWNMEAKERAWKNGTWDASWMCVDCLTAYHDYERSYTFQWLLGTFLRIVAQLKSYWQRRSDERMP